MIEKGIGTIVSVMPVDGGIAIGNWLVVSIFASLFVFVVIAFLIGRKAYARSKRG